MLGPNLENVMHHPERWTFDWFYKRHDMDTAENRFYRTAATEVDMARQTAEYWKAEHLAGNARIGELHDEAAARKCCTCDGAGRGPGRECVVKAGGRLGDLWRCADGLGA